MRALLPLTAVLSLGTWSPVTAQVTANTLEERLKSIDPQSVSEADCRSQFARAAHSNGPELIYGGRICETVGNLVESSFLFSAGQLRGTTDVLLLPPATQADDQSLMPLYTMFYFGGPIAGVKDEVLRDPAARESFLTLLDKWQPSYSPAYDPGWNARKRPDATKYESTVVEAKADLRKFLDRAIHLVSDDEYYSLYRRHTEILKRHPDGLPADTPEGRLANNVQKRIRERMIALGVDVGPSLEDTQKQMAETRESFPPHSPEEGEVVISGDTGPIAERCLDLAERSAVSQGGKIVRVLVTSNSRWGVIWRADIEGGDQLATRFTCTQRTSSSSPFDIGIEKIPPLPSS